MRYFSDKTKRMLIIAAAGVLLAVGFVGLVIPLLPGLPLIFLGLACSRKAGRAPA